MKTTQHIKKSEVQRKWYIADATDKVLGNLAVAIANVLRGKNKPSFTPNADTGDFVIVINADKIKVTGQKMEDKIYYTHSGKLGGLKRIALKDLLRKKPTQAIEVAIQGMIPRNRLRPEVMSKLKIYGGAEHQHQAQKPETLAI